MLLNQLKEHKERKEAERGNSFGSFNDDIRMYKSEIARLEIVVGELKEGCDRYKRMNEQLERN